MNEQWFLEWLSRHGVSSERLASPDATRVRSAVPPTRTVGQQPTRPPAPAEKEVSWLDFLPLIGDARAGAEARRELQYGHAGNAALIAALTLFGVPGGRRAGGAQRLLRRTGKSAPAQPLKGGIEAWHGSRERFDKFDPAFIGTGEGRILPRLIDEWGHGFYFSGSKDVAQGYRELLTSDMPVIAKAGDVSVQLPSTIGSDIRESGLARALERARRLKLPWAPELEALAKTGKPVTVEQPGALYRVNLDTEPASLLAMDELASEQSPQVQRALLNLGLSSADLPKMFGDDAYTALVKRFGSAPAASEALTRAGVPGARYPSGLLPEDLPVIEGTVPETATKNFVMFDPERIRILEMMALLGMIKASQSQQGRQRP